MALGWSLSDVDAMPATEFFEWMVFDSMEPIGSHRGDIQSGTVAAAIYNVNRTKPEQPVLNWSDVLPPWPGPKEKVEPLDLVQQMTVIQMFQNAYQEALSHEPAIDG